MGITKAYVEVYRSGFLVEEKLLTEVRDDLADASFQVSGGIATTHGDGFTEKSTGGSHLVCYSSPRSRENLEKAVRVAARVFDEVIVDDFLCTGCRCSRCREAKGDRDWAALYRDLLVDFARSGIIEPAKDENPSARMIIKYPQWYDRFHVFGYDVLAQSEAFDAVWVGTEIRDPRVDYVHQYQPFANYTYLHSVGGSKVEGAWFDFLWCYPEIYMEQAYQSLLAGAPELVLFSFGHNTYDRTNPNAVAFVERRDLLEKICAEMRGKKNVAIEAYKPPGGHPENESYLFDYLGVLGLPVVVSCVRPETPSVVLPVHSLKDPGVDEYLLEMGPGRTVLATSGLIEGLGRNEEVMKLFGLAQDPVRRRDIFTYRFRVDGETQLAEERVLMRSHLKPRGARIVAEAVGGRNYPILTVNEVEGTTYMAACLDTFRYLPHGETKLTVAEPVSLVHLPQAYLDSLRRPLLSRLGLRFQAPANVGLYLYSLQNSEDLTTLAIENFRDQGIEVRVGGPSQLKLLAGKADVIPDGDNFKIDLPRREIALLRHTC
jgi:hypothetical protein